MLFVGHHNHTMDGKGRVSVPAPFRDQLVEDQRLVLAPFTAFHQVCIDIYPYVAWEQLLAKYEAMPKKFGEAALRFEFGYLARAHRCDVDPAGRILVPPTMRQRAELKRDVVFTGSFRKFRLMDRDKWERLEGEHDAAAVESPAIYGDLEL